MTEHASTPPPVGGPGDGVAVTLKPLLDFTPPEWRTLHGFFRNRELADWNDAKPIHLPEWLFRRIMQDEERGGERAGFGIMDEAGVLIGSAELYDLRPPPPLAATTGTLGIMIGYPELWGRGYGRSGVTALLRWAFETHDPPLARVRLTTFGHNRRAQRAFTACGFYETGRTERPRRVDVHMEVGRAQWRSLNVQPSE